MEKLSFKKNEIVWAKVRGHPWWPAVFIEVERRKEEESAVVNFIGDRTHAFLPLDKVAQYDLKYKELSKTKRRDLQDAIKVANKIKANPEQCTR